MRQVPGYVQRFLDKLSHCSETPDGWRARCPSTGHGDDGLDRTPSFFVSIGNAGKIIFYCQSGCRYHEVMSSLQLRGGDLTPDLLSGEEPMAPLAERRGEASAVDRSLWHRVYSSLLQLLPLEKAHAKDLLARGLPKSEQDLRGYRSIRPHYADKVSKDLFQEYGEALYQVPGFVDVSGVPTLKGLNGILFPVTDLDRNVLALKVRSEGDPKYLWLSSLPTGRGPGSPVHCPVQRIGQDLSCVRVTEGEIKADVATYKSDLYTIGLPGVSNWWRCLDVLAATGCKEVVVSWDYRDVRFKKQVATQCVDFVRALLDRGYKVYLEAWDVRHKGIDDALVAEETIELVEDPLTHLGTLPSLLGHPVQSEWQPKPFPVDALPAPVRAYCKAVSEALPCPLDFVGLSCLTVAGTAVGFRTQASFAPGWLEHPSLFSFIVGPPGSLKTPAMSKVTKPLHRIQQEYAEQYASEVSAYALQEIAADARMAAYKAEIRKLYKYNPNATPADEPDPPQPAPPEPRQQLLLLNDITIESMVDKLNANPWGLLLETDEGVQIMRSLNQYRGGKGADKQKYLSIWSGKPIQVNRKSEKASVYVQRPFLSILAGIQPDMLGELQEERGREDGFVHRILFAMPQTEKLPPFNREGISEEAEQVWERVVRGLRAELPATVEPPTPRVVLPSEAALQYFDEWHKRHKKESDAVDFRKEFEGPWSKLKAYYVRLALIVWLLRRACIHSGLESGTLPECIEVEDMEAAERLIDYFKDHLNGVYEKFRFDGDDRQIDDFVGWVKSRGSRVPLQEVRLEAGRWRLKGKAEVRRFVEKACDRNFGYFSSEKVSGRVKEYFVLGNLEE